MDKKKIWEAGRFPNKYKSYTVDSLKNEGSEHVKYYIANMKDYIAKGKGLWIKGPTGVGKTTAAIVMGMESWATYGKPSLFVTYEQIKEETGKSFQGKEDPDFFKRLKNWPHLIIDNISSSIMQDKIFGLKKLESLIRERNNNLLITSMTGSWKKGEIGPENKDDVELLVDTGKSCFVSVVLDGQNLRDLEEEKF